MAGLRARRSELILYTTAINAIGDGLFTIVGTLFFIQVIGMPVLDSD